MDSMASFELKRPRSLAEASAALVADPTARLVAGGTDLVPNLRRGLGQPATLVDLSAIASLASLAIDDRGLALGAGVTLARLATDPQLGAHFPAIAEAARSVAGPTHRLTATLGGNLCLDTRCVFYNQSEWWRAASDGCLKYQGTVCHVAPQGKRCHAAFSGDLAPALLALDAEVEITGPAGARRMPLAELYRDDGAAHLSLAHGEIVSAVRVAARPANARNAYRKSRVRGAIDFPLAGVAVEIATRDGKIERLVVAMTGTNSRPVRLAGTDAFAGRAVEDGLLGELGKLVQKQASPMRTTLAASNYRRQVAAALARRLVQELALSA